MYLLPDFASTFKRQVLFSSTLIYSKTLYKTDVSMHASVSNEVRSGH